MIRIERRDDDFGRWMLARWEPPELADVVEGLWYFEGSLSHPRERHLPDGRAELIVHLGPVYRLVEGERLDPFPSACASGLLLGPELIEAPPGRSAVLGIRLKPVGAFAVLGGTLEPLTGVTTDLQDVAGWDARRLVDRCDAARSPEARLRVAAAWIAERISAGPSPDAAVDWVSRSIERSHGMASIGDLTERSGWSSTRLVETFRRQVGVPPKRFARIMRFQHALGLVTTGRAPLSGIALEAGYCDQSHFNGDFREMSGLTPTAYRAALRFPGSANLAEHSE